ncbi:MAG: hypothetical protein DSZ00_01715 [Gammaproteobacteria bacterium]|nr:MAG: hypothetical protein DSZ00_01715 [Gammaproteobacteria bacterium]RTZ76202.1 MAG: hypothetical protein DSZ02_01920 [Gammaproteobacteria bacterium]
MTGKILFRRLLKTLGYTIAGVVLLLLSALVLFQLSSQETRRDLLIGAVETATGGTLQVGTPFRLELGRELLLEVAGLQLQSPEGKPWFDAQQARLHFPLLPLLLHRRLELTLQLEKSHLYLGKEETGGEGTSLPFTPVPVEIRLSKLEVLQFADDKDGKARPVASLDHALLREEQGAILLDLKGNYSGFPLQMKTVSSTEKPNPAGNRNIRLSGTLGRLQLSGEGWQAPWSGDAIPHFEVHLRMKAPGLRIFNGRLFAGLPDMGPLEAGLQLKWDGTLSAHALSLRLRDKAVELDAKGRIADLLTGKGMEIRLQASSARPVELLKRWGIEIPPVLKRLEASALLHGNYARPALGKIRIDGRGEHLTLQASGKLADLLTGQGLELPLQLHSSDAAALLEALGASAPAGLHRLELSGRLLGPWRQTSLRALELQLTGEELAFRSTGELDNLFDPAHLKLQLEGDGTAEGQPLKVAMKLDRKASPPITFHIAGPGMELNGKGSFQVNQEQWRAELEIDGSARDLARIGKLLEVELNPVEPVRARTRLVLEPGRLLLQKLEFSAGRNDLGGDLAFTRPRSGKLQVQGNLESEVLDLSELIPKEKRMEIKFVDKGEEVPLSELQKAAQKQLFTDEPIELGWLETMDTRIRFRFGELRNHRVLLKRLEGSLALQERQLDLHIDKGIGGGKPVKGEFHLDGTAAPVKWSLRSELSDADLATLLPGFQLPPKSGTLSLKLDLHSRGNTPAAILAGLEGNKTLLLRDTPFAFTQPNELGRSLLSRLDPAGAKQGRDRIECAALYVEFADGMARTPRKIAVQFPEVTWLGDGVLDLKTEQISLKMTPYPRTGLGLSLGGIADIVAVSGTLSRPYIIVNPSGALLTSLSLTAAAATGGTSLLIQGLLDRNLVSGDVCGPIFSGEEPGKKPATAKPRNKTKKTSNLDILDQE